MPFTSPLLTAVAGLQFDCLIENTGTYSQSGSGGSNKLKTFTSGAFNVISDPKSIVTQVFNTSTRDVVQLTTSGTLKITVISNYSYSSTNSLDKAGLASASLASDGDFSIGAFNGEHVTFQNGASQTVENQTFDNGATRPGLFFHILRSGSGETFTASGRLLIGINKT